MLNPPLYVRYIIEAAPTEFFIVNFRSSYDWTERLVVARKRKRKPLRYLIRNPAAEVTYYRDSTIGVTMTLRLLPSEIDGARLQVQLNQLRTLDSVKAAITEQLCMQRHVETPLLRNGVTHGTEMNV